MITIDRRKFLAGTAGMAFVSAFPLNALSETHDALKIAIAAGTGDHVPYGGEAACHLAGADTYALI